MKKTIGVQSLLLPILLTLLPVGASADAGRQDFTLGFDGLFLGQAASDSPQPSQFAFQQADLTLSGTVDPTWNLFGDLRINSGGLSPEEVFAVANPLPWLRLRAGEMYVPVGKQALLRPYAYPFVREPLAVENTLGDDGLNEAGVEATVTAPFPWDCELVLGGYQEAGAKGDSPLDLGGTSYDNFPYLLHLKNQFDLGDDTTLEAGGSSLTGMGSNGIHNAVYGADLTFQFLSTGDDAAGGVIVQTEYLNRLSYDSTGTYAPGSDGWYASLQYRWTPIWWSGVRAEEEFHGSTNDLEEDSNAGSQPGHLQRLCVNLAWVPSDSSFIRVEYDLTREDPDGGGATLWDHRILIQLNTSIGLHFSNPASKG